MAELWKGHEEQQPSTVVISESTMDVPGLLSRELRVHSCNQAVDSGWQRWQFSAETGSVGHSLGISLDGV